MEPARRRLAARASLGLGVLVVVLIVAWVGVTPFRDGLRSVTWPAIVGALALTALTTLAQAVRWRAVAAALGARLELGASVRAYYRSQLLNSLLPLGVLGDVHRAVDTGLADGGVGLHARAVVVERLAGQLVLLSVAAVPLTVVVGTPWWISVGLAGAVAVGVFALRRASSVVRRDLAAVAPATPVLVATSLVALAGYCTLFVVAVRLSATPLGLLDTVAAAVLVVGASAIPTNVAGWGPREGAAGAVFVALGHPAAEGVAVSVTYGVLSLLSLAPALVTVLPRRAARGEEVRA